MIIRKKILRNEDPVEGFFRSSSSIFLYVQSFPEMTIDTTTYQSGERPSVPPTSPVVPSHYHKRDYSLFISIIIGNLRHLVTSIINLCIYLLSILPLSSDSNNSNDSDLIGAIATFTILPLILYVWYEIPILFRSCTSTHQWRKTIQNTPDWSISCWAQLIAAYYWTLIIPSSTTLSSSSRSPQDHREQSTQQENNKINGILNTSNQENDQISKELETGARPDGVEVRREREGQENDNNNNVVNILTSDSHLQTQWKLNYKEGLNTISGIYLVSKDIPLSICYGIFLNRYGWTSSSSSISFILFGFVLSVLAIFIHFVSQFDPTTAIARSPEMFQTTTTTNPLTNNGNNNRNGNNNSDNNNNNNNNNTDMEDPPPAYQLTPVQINIEAIFSRIRSHFHDIWMNIQQEFPEIRSNPAHHFRSTTEPLPLYTPNPVTPSIDSNPISPEPQPIPDDSSNIPAISFSNTNRMDSHTHQTIEPNPTADRNENQAPIHLQIRENPNTNVIVDHKTKSMLDLGTTSTSIQGIPSRNSIAIPLQQDVTITTKEENPMQVNNSIHLIQNIENIHAPEMDIEPELSNVYPQNNSNSSEDIQMMPEESAGTEDIPPPPPAWPGIIRDPRNLGWNT